MRILLVLCFVTALAGTAKAQETPRSESKQAEERIRMAHLAVPTTQQCLADLSSWTIRSDADEKMKVEIPNWWYQQLSTEELERLSHEMLSCTSLLRRAHREEMIMILFYERQLDDELLIRAKEVLADHYLTNEYLKIAAK